VHFGGKTHKVALRKEGRRRRSCVRTWSRILLCQHPCVARHQLVGAFRRQASDPKITRGEALRQAMISLIDQGGYVDGTGKMLFSYAHPLFWAPYSIIGDGGAQ